MLSFFRKKSDSDLTTKLEQSNSVSGFSNSSNNHVRKDYNTSLKELGYNDEIELRETIYGNYMYNYNHIKYSIIFF